MRVQSSILTQDRSLRSTLLVAAGVLTFALLTAAGSQIKFYLPFTPVPVTLQSLAVVLAGGFLGSRAGLASQVLMVLLGVLGLPVLTNSDVSVVQALTGATGGYILGFLFCAYVVGKMQEANVFRGFMATYGYLFAASLFIFIPGVIWLKFFLNLTWTTAIIQGFIPFLIGDLLKTLIAAGAVTLFVNAKQR